MNDINIEKEIRKKLIERFPDSAFMVTYIDGHLDVDFIGGKLHQYNFHFPPEIELQLMEAIWEVLPDYYFWFD